MKDGARRRVCVVITARPSYARIKTVMEAIRAHPALELQLVVGASALLERYGPVVDVIRADGFEPDAVVYMVVEGENLVIVYPLHGRAGCISFLVWRFTLLSGPSHGRPSLVLPPLA